MSDIVIATLNAQYIHASLGLRYLYANMGELRDATTLAEFAIDQRPLDIAEKILAHAPRIVGLGVYIWNVEQTTQLVALLKRIRPELVVVVGGPEVSYEYEEQPIVRNADYLITGPADLEFPQLCARVLNSDAPRVKVIAATMPALETITLPYAHYTDNDIAHRLIYVEASRGCPFKCEFCLSSLDKTAWPFDIDLFLAEMQKLYARGARHFKFVDRTFNLNIKVSRRILEFFLERMDEHLFIHFEMIPDHLPDALKDVIARFRPGSLQFEIGIQSFNPETQAHISRKQNSEKTTENLRWLRQQSTAHIHADLIAGLPGEDLTSFGKGFDQLVALNPHEIQVGILKRLRGTPIIRHTAAFDMRYNPHPPYNILSTNVIDFTAMQRLNRFARYWDMIGNSGRFVYTKPLLLGDQPFARFLRLSDWLFATTGQTHQIGVDRLFDLVHRGMTGELSIDLASATDVLARDYRECGARGAPQFLAHQPRPTTSTTTLTAQTNARRQARHRRESA